MRHLLLLLSLVVIFPLGASACLSAYQFKVFPIGMVGDKILTMDVQIQRTDQAALARFGKEPDEHSEFAPMWILNIYVVRYDHQQQVISKEHVEETYSLDGDYAWLLQKRFDKVYRQSMADHPGLVAFEPVYISFCDFQKDCEMVSLRSDSVAQTDEFIYRNQSFQVPVFRDTSSYGFRFGSYHPPMLTDLYANSVRVYRAGQTELVVTHVTNGHELAMGYLSSDPEFVKKREAEGEGCTLLQEHRPDFAWEDLSHSVYEEPWLHHGYGVDLFVVKQ